MEREEIRARVIDILTSKDFGSLQVDVTQLTEDTSLLNDITLDSLQLLELIVAMENTFGFKADTKRLDVDIFDRFGRVVDFVADNLQGNATASTVVSHA
jgi:diaminopimelate decarboxylase